MKDLTKYNYDDLVEKVTALLKDKEGWGDAYQSSVGQTLIQLLADTTDNLHYLLERRSIEGFMHHARLETSVIARSSELGYRLKRATAHGGVLRLKILDSNGAAVPPIFELYVPKMSIFNFGDRQFYSINAHTMYQDQDHMDIPVREGKSETKVFQPSELNSMNEVLIPIWENIDEYSLVVMVGGEEWHDVRSLDDVNKRALSYALPTDQLYDIKYSADGMHIIFGDDWFGAKPKNAISVTYMMTTTVDPIYATEMVFSPALEFTDKQDPTISYETDISNITIMSGGHPRESVESIRKNATIYHQTNGRGVTNTDYAFWAQKAGVGGIVDVRVHGEEEIGTHIYNSNNVFVTYAKGDYTKLTLTEKTKLREYLDNVKTTQAHLVISPATVFHVIAEAAVKKYSTVPIANAHTYNLIKNFIRDKFSVKLGSVGGEHQNSDVVNDFYGIKIEDNGIKKPLVDFVKWDMKIGIDFQFPSAVRNAIVGISPRELETLPLGTEWVIILDGIICKTSVQENDTTASMLLRMRDVVRELTDIDARILLEGAALDNDGNFVPIEIEPNVGYHLLIGRESSNRTLDDVIEPVTIGSTVAEPKVYSDRFSVTHYYYNPKAGFRPTIPLRNSTVITYTPVDTRVEVWVKKGFVGDSEYKLHETIEVGETYTETFTDEHLLKFNLLSDSYVDTTVDIAYSTWRGATIGLDLKHINMHSFFTVDAKTGGFKDTAYVDYKVVATRPSAFIQNKTPMIERGTVVIYDEDGNVVATDTGYGDFDRDGGRIDYLKGIITPPPFVDDGRKYMATYKQDEFGNIQLGDSDVLKLDDVPEEEGNIGYLSKIRII